ncbi:MAG TPA: alpha/beta fold hydrolase [Nocardioides sp.]
MSRERGPAISSAERPGAAAPRLLCLHALGGSSRSFDLLAAALAPDVRLLALDLPGFGADDEPAAGCAAMVRSVAKRIAGLGAADGPLVLLGHSMGGKVVTLLASGAVVTPPAGLAGVVLVAASPVVPEPMDEQRRRRMVGWADEGPLARSAADEFLAANTHRALSVAVHDAAVRDLRRADPVAWRRWLLSGSREDWSARVRQLDVPALVVAGAEDGDLGPAAQRDLHENVATHTELLEIAGAAHLVPLEQPVALAAAVSAAVARWT